MKPNNYLKWWRRHFTPRFSKLQTVERLTNKLWTHYNDIQEVRSRLDAAFMQF